VKLVIVADSDQWGASGVGDYALKLTNLLLDRGINVAFEAFTPLLFTDQSLVERVLQYDADWVSLHFVPYVFATHGLVGSHTLPWHSLRGRVGINVIFHEIWIGAHQGASWRHSAIGFLQRMGIHQVLSQLRPELVHCTTPLYSAMLQRVGIPNKLLPLFSNIPIVPFSFDPYPDLLSSIVPGSERINWTVAIFFGSIYPSLNLIPALRWLKDKSISKGKRLLILSVGNCPNAVQSFRFFASCMSEACAVYFHVIGKLDATSISSWIRHADCGLATTPYNIIAKSGSALCFAEHGIPVIVMDEGSQVRGLNDSLADLLPEFWLYGDKRLDEMDDLPPRREPLTRQDSVVSQFMTDLDL